MYMGQVRGIWELSVLFNQFFCKLKNEISTLPNTIHKNKLKMD